MNQTQSNLLLLFLTAISFIIAISAILVTVAQILFWNAFASLTEIILIW